MCVYMHIIVSLGYSIFGLHKEVTLTILIVATLISKCPILSVASVSGTKLA
uniref:Uncharacterized protein n=1 Tax=Arundo donax TaxID=35708 RepID=A0A0A9C5Q9_ARUDO